MTALVICNLLPMTYSASDVCSVAGVAPRGTQLDCWWYPVNGSNHPNWCGLDWKLPEKFYPNGTAGVREAMRVPLMLCVVGSCRPITCTHRMHALLVICHGTSTMLRCDVFAGCMLARLTWRLSNRVRGRGRGRTHPPHISLAKTCVTIVWHLLAITTITNAMTKGTILPCARVCVCVLQQVLPRAVRGRVSMVGQRVPMVGHGRQRVAPSSGSRQ
jgi:hypothetical protein